MQKAIYNKVNLNAIGVYIPKSRKSNLDIIDKFDLNEHFLKEKVGFLKLARKDQNETTTTLCCKAVEDLASNISFNKDEISVLIVVTQNPDQYIPHTSAIVHNTLGLSEECMTFDISQGCAGYIHALSVAKSLLNDKGMGKAIVITSDPYSKIVNPNSKAEAILFGDGATASLLSFDTVGYHIEDSVFGTAKESNECISCNKSDYLTMQGSAILANIMNYVVPSIKNFKEDLVLRSPDDNKIDLFLVHQGSKYAVDNIRHALNISQGMIPFQSKDYGNLVSSSIPVMIKNIFSSNKYKNILLSGFGVGFSWGNCLIKLI